MDASDLTVWLAFGAGFLSFISPCCLPLYPSFLSYITGVSVNDLREERAILKKSAFLHTMFFILGFSIIFFAMGLSVSWIGRIFTSNQQLIQQLGGIFIGVMGLIMMGILQSEWIMKEKRINYRNKPVGYLGSTLVGITYAAGWTPCVGPILTATLTLGITRPDQAALYLTAYTLGFALPFFFMAFFIGRVKCILKYSSQMMKIGGAMMVLTGILLYTDHMKQITIFFIRLYGGFTGF